MLLEAIDPIANNGALDIGQMYDIAHIGHMSYVENKLLIQQGLMVLVIF